MKSEHRHELKTNELAEWLMNFPEWIQENLRTIIYVSIVIVLVVGVYIYKKYEKNVVEVQKQVDFTNLLTQVMQVKTAVLNPQAREIDISYAFIDPMNKLGSLGQSTKNNDMGALALIKYAETIRAEMHYRREAVPETELTTQIAKAKESYSQAILKSTDNPSLRGAAKYGLGLCEEELGKFAEAANIYKDIVADSSLAGTVASVQAKQRLPELADYQKKITFLPPPKPAPAPATAPMIKPDAPLGPTIENAPATTIVKPEVNAINVPGK